MALYCGCFGEYEFIILIATVLFSFIIGYASGWVNEQKYQERKQIKKDMEELKNFFRGRK
jgi:L-cystine uptake protein TcyP (sodium:dicarboxylate symporter family)